MDHTVANATGSLAATLIRVHCKLVPLGDTLSINEELRLDTEPWVQLVAFVEGGGWVALLTLESDNVTCLSARRWANELNSRLIRRLSAQNHTMARVPS